MAESPTVGSESDAYRRLVARRGRRVAPAYRPPPGTPTSSRGFPAAAGLTQADVEQLELEEKLLHFGRTHVYTFDMSSPADRRRFSVVQDRVLGRVAIKRREVVLPAPDGTGLKIFVEWLDMIEAGPVRPVPRARG